MEHNCLLVASPAAPRLEDQFDRSELVKTKHLLYLFDLPRTPVEILEGW
jgi:hypothetical protein